MKKLLLVIASLSAFALSAFAGGWSHGQYSPGSYSASVYVPSAAHVQQTFQAFNYGGGYGQVVNDGPLGNYNAVAGPQQYYQGDIGGGGYVSVYQVVIVSGYSVTVIAW